MGFHLSPRERHWFDAVLALAAFALGYVVLGDLAVIFGMFSDLILVFFLAWLLAFMLSPIVSHLTRIPFMGRAAATVVVYAALFAGIVGAAISLATVLVGSVGDFIAYVPHLHGDLPRLLAPWQARLDAFGVGRVDLVAGADSILDSLNHSAGQLVAPLQSIAVASVGAIGGLLLIVIFSLYMVIDRDHLVAFLFRLVPAGYKEDARVVEAAVGRSFGGFLRGQVLTGLAFAVVAAAASAVLGLGFAGATTAAAGVLMAIPFFGPFVAWAPPVLVAVFSKPDAVLPTVIVMAAGWLVVMNVLNPRIMADALRIHPIVVLTSVLVGLKVAGIGGAIFGIPIAAVLSALFFHSMGRAMDSGRTADRAARLVTAREGREVSAPREPDAAVDADIEAPPLT